VAAVCVAEEVGDTVEKDTVEKVGCGGGEEVGGESVPVNASSRQAR